MHMNDHTAILSARKGFRMVFLRAQFRKRTVCPDIHSAKSGPVRRSGCRWKNSGVLLSYIGARSKKVKGQVRNCFRESGVGSFRDGVVTVGIKI